MQYLLAKILSPNAQNGNKKIVYEYFNTLPLRTLYEKIILTENRKNENVNIKIINIYNTRRMTNQRLQKSKVNNKYEMRGLHHLYTETYNKIPQEIFEITNKKEQDRKIYNYLINTIDES